MALVLASVIFKPASTVSRILNPDQAGVKREKIDETTCAKQKVLTENRHDSAKNVDRSWTKRRKGSRWAPTKTNTKTRYESLNLKTLTEHVPCRHGLLLQASPLCVHPFAPTPDPTYPDGHMHMRPWSEPWKQFKVQADDNNTTPTCDLHVGDTLYADYSMSNLFAIRDLDLLSCRSTSSITCSFNLRL